MSHKIITIEDMQKMASLKGGKCLSTKYIDSRTKLKWQCKYTHKWNAAPNTIQQGYWCSNCAGNKPYSIEDMFILAKSKGGKCLSDKYINSKLKLQWECKDKHKWNMSYGHVKKGQWCPECSEGLSERICRRFFEEIFKDKFPKKRYDWLLSPKGKKLELDGYNEKLKLAFEYQGRQHYDLKGFIKNKKKVNYLKICDEIKRNECIKKDILLVEIPYTIKYDNMETYILNKTNSTAPFLKLDHRDWNIYSMNKIKELIDKAKSKGGKLLSTKYISCRTEYKWECKNNHVWNTSWDNVRSGTWCPECYKEEIYGSLKKMQDLALLKGGKCLSDKYINMYTKLKWICKEGHKWKSLPLSVKAGNWCPTCGYKKAWETKRRNGF